ncbi:protein maelstrom-like [Drosophila innubila]|uniref:protein maelstrom-like n=1 Tax=Drosophila innubila TaxID=198719 RepID=UPI00148BDDD2|nr:protein maelstrom-like [Drosophila innubila]
MPPKKHNAFMMFVHQWRNNNAEGRRMTTPQAVAHCGEIWKNMTEQQRGPYSSQAKNANVAARAKREPMNSCGQAISAVEQEEREAAEKQMQMKLAIERILRDGREQHDLENTKFVFAAFNYFVKNNESIYIPAEFAACLYSLKSGKTSTYSSLINPDHLIFGHNSEARDHAESTHQLPLPPNAMGESDMSRLYSNILEYLRSCHSDNPHGPLVVFTSSELMPVVKGCFRYLSCDMDEEDKQNILVYDIQYLFYVLKKEVMEMAHLPSNTINKSITDTIFANDFFEYHSGISCQYHEDRDRSKYCTQSMVARWSYILSDHLCGHLAIKLLLGKHLPPKQERKFKVISPNVDDSSRNTSFVSCKSEVKQENKFVPTDHLMFSASVENASDFPSLNARKPRVNHQPLSDYVTAQEPAKNVWNVSASKRSVKDVEDSFNMSRRH